MKISKALIEKYERGLCTDQERAAIQKWLESDTWDDFDPGEVAMGSKDDIWKTALGNSASPKNRLILPQEAPAEIPWVIYTCVALFLLIGFVFFLLA